MIDLDNEQKLQDTCKAFRVKSLHVFGSFASGQMTANSDIDLLVEFERESYSGSFEQLMDFKEQMEAHFQRSVDIIVNRPFRNPHFQDEVNRTKQLVYAA